LLGGPSYSFTVHGTDFFDAPRSQDISAKVANAAFVVAVCDYGAAQLRRWSAVEDWGKIHVVRCAIGDKFFTSARPIDRSSERFVCVGRLSPEKGQLVLLDALATLVREGSGARLVLAGDGDFRPEIERRIAQLDLADRVEITGFIPEEEVCRQVLGARAFVLASFTEGLPVVIMEAFALGRPVISTYVAGIPELVRPGENGWLVPAGNAAELASAMRAALNTPIERLEAMALAGSERVRSLHYTPTESARLAVLFGRAVEGTCGRAVG
jgi:glycosyltransferase involved in cell wall biosynthesis